MLTLAVIAPRGVDNRRSVRTTERSSKEVISDESREALDEAGECTKRSAQRETGV